MADFMIEFPHSEDQCERLLSESQQSGQMPDVYYGCAAGRHTAWAIVNAGDEDGARSMIPEPLRSDAKITPVQQKAA